MAAGERGASPDIHIFELSSGRCTASLSKGHKFGIGSISFSSDGKLMASTGASYDGHLCVWEWRSGVQLARQPLNAVGGGSGAGGSGGGLSACFTEDGSCIVTSGKEHFKVRMAWTNSWPRQEFEKAGIKGITQIFATPSIIHTFMSSFVTQVWSITQPAPVRGSRSSSVSLAPKPASLKEFK